MAACQIGYVSHSLGFWYVASLTNATLAVVWKRDLGCDSLLQDIYQPIPRTIFFEDANETLPIVTQAQQRGDAVLALKLSNKRNVQSAIEIHDHDKRGWLHQQSDGELGDFRKDLVFRLYQLLRPVPRLQVQIDTFAKASNISSCGGFHIRRTGLISHTQSQFWKSLNRANKTVDDVDNTFFDIVREGIKLDESQRYFLTTDNPDTQLKFETASDFSNGTIFAFGQIRGGRKFSKKSNGRYTSVDRAVIDAHLLARCREIHGTPGSSYTELAVRLHQIRLVNGSDVHL